MLELQARIETELKQATRERDQVRVVALRSVKNALHNQAIVYKTRGEKMPENELIKILRSEVKKRREAKELYEQGKRSELAAREEAELKILEQYLPVAPAADQVRQVAQSLKQELAITDKKELGRLTKALLDHFSGSVDGKTASAIAREVLTS
ncbi:MAG: GatB/YqeY domain-containing protein [Patescibacteria group bacterium]